MENVYLNGRAAKDIDTFVDKRLKDAGVPYSHLPLSLPRRVHLDMIHLSSRSHEGLRNHRANSGYCSAARPSSTGLDGFFGRRKRKPWTNFKDRQDSGVRVGVGVTRTFFAALGALDDVRVPGGMGCSAYGHLPSAGLHALPAVANVDTLAIRQIT